MVRKLTSIVIQKTNWCFDDSLMFAQEMLDEVEEVGMSPPSGKWVRDDANMTTFVRGWEAEDET